MKIYLISLAVGVLVGVIYGLLHVRSPAPPVVALIGLFGMLAGEQIPPLIKSLWLHEPLAVSWLQRIQPHVFGSLPAAPSVPVPSARQGPDAVPRVQG